MPDEFDPIPLNDPDDPRITEYRQLRENRLPRPLPGAPMGVFIAEGEKVVRMLAEHPAGSEGSPQQGGRPCRFEPRSVLVSHARLASDALWLRRFPPTVPIYAASQPVMDAIVGFPIHRGIVASVLRIPDPALSELLGSAQTLLIGEGLANHDNLGGLFRLAAALAPRSAILLDPTSCDPLYRKAVRVSMGHALRVPFATARPWPGVLDQVRAAGWTVIALTPDPSAVDISTIEPGAIRRPALLLGAEGPGLTDQAAGKTDIRVRIPIVPGVDSLNVVTAAAIALHRLAGPPAAAGEHSAG